MFEQTTVVLSGHIDIPEHVQDQIDNLQTDLNGYYEYVPFYNSKQNLERYPVLCKFLESHGCGDFVLIYFGTW